MRWKFCSATTVALSFVVSAAWAEEPPPTDDWFAPAPPAPPAPPAAPQPPPPPLQGYEPLPPGAPVPPNIVTRPEGSASVSRTPEGGVDVHAQTSSGTVHAYGCSRVDVDPRAHSTAPPGPCPYPHASPYPYPQPYPTYTYPQARPLPIRPLKKAPRWAPDPARRGALIASSILFGLGTAVSATAYIFSSTMSSMCRFGDCHAEPSMAALWAMGTFLTVTPSIPRYVVGDMGKGLLLTALRGGSFAAGVLLDWNDPTYMLPATLAFVAPLTLGIVDLATTPHREQIEARRKREHGALHPSLLGLGPTVASDLRGQPIPALGAMGTF